MALANARLKALQVQKRHPAAVILAADTIVVLEDQILGKPRDLTEARQFLRRLSGVTHQVITGVFLAKAEQTEAFHVTSEVTFHPLTEAQISSFFSRVDPLDKAGGYAAQEDDGTLIAGIRGCRDNVIGLPLSEVRCRLQKFFPELSKLPPRDIGDS